VLPSYETHLARRQRLADWKKALFDMSDTKVLLYLDGKGACRYSDLLEQVVTSRSTLAASLAALQNLKLIDRRVKDTRPVQTEYKLTEKGKALVKLLLGIRDILGV
jgi:DNA-binding HxlR family transcriptional regulator